MSDPDDILLDESLPPKVKHRTLLRIVKYTTLVGCILLSYIIYRGYCDSNRVLKQLSSLKHLEMGGDFELVDADEKKFTQDNIKGKWTILYFGFSRCPEICPEALTKITEVLNNLGQDYVDLYINTVFVSLDPKRDSPAAVKDFLKDYHPSIVGCTGSEKQIEHIAKMFRTYCKISQQTSEDDYILDHTTAIFILDHNGYATDYFFRSEATEAIVKKLQLLVRYQFFKEEIYRKFRLN